MIRSVPPLSLSILDKFRPRGQGLASTSSGASQVTSIDTGMDVDVTVEGARDRNNPKNREAAMSHMVSQKAAPPQGCDQGDGVAEFLSIIEQSRQFK